MKKLIGWSLFLLASSMLTVAVAGVATVEKIQVVEENSAAKKVDVSRGGKAVAVSESESVELNDVIDTANKEVTLKTENGSEWALKEKTKFSVHSAAKGKVVYLLQDGIAEYKASDKASEITVKINGKDYLVSADAKVSFSTDSEITALAISSGTVKFGNQVFDTNKTVKIDSHGNVNVLKMRGVRG